MFNMFNKSYGALMPVRVAKRKVLSTAERLYRSLQAHRDRQNAVLTEAERAKYLAATPLAKFLLGIIEDNEATQLELLDRMTVSLRDALYWTYSPDALPELAGQERRAALESMKKLLRLERERVRGAHRLAKSYSGIDDGLEQALLEASAASSEGNIRLLRLLIDRLDRTCEKAPEVITPWQPAIRERLAARQRAGDTSTARKHPTVAA